MSTVSEKSGYVKATLPIVITLLHGVFLYGLCIWLWGREHYQFFPLVMGASGCLAWHRLRGHNWGAHPPTLTIRTIALGILSLGLFTLAATYDSNWIGALSCIVSLWTATWLIGGQTLADKLRGPIFFLLLAVPLPLNLDLKLIIELQKTASSAASSLLDMQQIRHTISGVAFSTETRNFMVEEACSGIHSLFSCLCVIVFVSIMQKYSLTRIVSNIIQTIGWVLAANTLRVFLVVYCFSKWNLSLDTGWRHELLGVFTYATALLMSFSTDRLFKFIVPLETEPAANEAAYTESENAVRQLMKFTKKTSKNWNTFLNRSRTSESTSRNIVAIVLALGFLPLSGISYARMVRVVTRESTSNFSATMNNFANEKNLPTTLDNWNLIKVDRLNRTPDDPLGTNSTIFNYEGNGLFVQFSIDGYYPAWHDLAYCYTGIGWNLQSAENYQLADTTTHATLLSLYKESGEQAVSFFSCYDSNFASVTPKLESGGTLRTLLNRIKWDDIGGDNSTTVVPPVFQLQLMCSSNYELLDHERESLKQLFEKLSTEALSTQQEPAQ